MEHTDDKSRPQVDDTMLDPRMATMPDCLHSRFRRRCRAACEPAQPAAVQCVFNPGGGRQLARKASDDIIGLSHRSSSSSPAASSPIAAPAQYQSPSWRAACKGPVNAGLRQPVGLTLPANAEERAHQPLPGTQVRLHVSDQGQGDEQQDEQQSSQDINKGCRKEV
eukprot:351773-Chlamydomonas_euryale.AAC.22